MRNYQDAHDYLGKKTDRPLSGRATRIQRRPDGSIAIKYQATDVVSYRPDDTIELRTDGWQTPTTKARINEYTAARVFTEKGIWYLADRRNGSISYEHPSLFYDGVVITPAGQPLTPKYPTKTDQAVKRRLDRAVSSYIRRYGDLVASGELSDPGAGDCFGCSFHVVGTETPKQGPFGLEGKATPHGRVEPLGIDHYLSHLGLEDPEEIYFVPSLLWNAISSRGYRDPAFIWQMIKGRNDRDLAMMNLRTFFRNLKPALLAELTARQARS